MANIYGSDNDDILVGTDEDDSILSQGGVDTVTGGDGNDTFELRGWGNNKFGTLTITDFTAGDGAEDRIDLDGHSWELSGVQIARCPSPLKLGHYFVPDRGDFDVSETTFRRGHSEAVA